VVNEMTYDEWLAHMKITLKKNKGNIQKTASDFGLPHSAIYSILKRDRPGFKTFHKWLDAHGK
jgi:hypothetical protein